MILGTVWMKWVVSNHACPWQWARTVDSKMRLTGAAIILTWLLTNFSALTHVWRLQRGLLTFPILHSKAVLLVRIHKSTILPNLFDIHLVKVSNLLPKSNLLILYLLGGVLCCIRILKFVIPWTTDRNIQFSDKTNEVTPTRGSKAVYTKHVLGVSINNKAKNR